MYLSTFKKMSTSPVLVLGIYLGYLVYLSTWPTVLDPNPAVHPLPPRTVEGGFFFRIGV